MSLRKRSYFQNMLNMVKYGQNLNFLYGCHGYQNKIQILWLLHILFPDFKDNV